MDVRHILPPTRYLLHCLIHHEAGLHLYPKIASLLLFPRGFGLRWNRNEAGDNPESFVVAQELRVGRRRLDKGVEDPWVCDGYTSVVLTEVDLPGRTPAGGQGLLAALFDSANDH